MKKIIFILLAVAIASCQKPEEINPECTNSNIYTSLSGKWYVSGIDTIDFDNNNVTNK